jgi:hypothetical protein
MGKVTGFLEFERLEEGYEPVGLRLKNWKEFVIGLSADQARVQGARCMDCGTPFCNQGCPVNNIIPDFNDLVYRGDWQQAIDVLHQTNNFPEFTGRVCPAPCEAACTLNVNDERGGHQEPRARDHRPGLGRGLGAAATGGPAKRPARWPWSAAARPAWRRRSSWRAPATR